MKVGSGMAAVYSNYIGKNDIDNFPASGYTLKELLRLRMWRNGRRTSLRSWRATVGVQVPSAAVCGAEPNRSGSGFAPFCARYEETGLSEWQMGLFLSYR